MVIFSIFTVLLLCHLLTLIPSYGISEHEKGGQSKLILDIQVISEP